MKNWQSMANDDLLRELVHMVPAAVHSRIGEWFDVAESLKQGDLVPYQDLMELSEELEKAQADAHYWQERYEDLLNQQEDDGK